MKPFLSSVNVCHRILDCYFWVFAIELCQQLVMPKQIYGRLNNMSLCLTVSMVNFRPLSVFYLSITVFSTDSVAFFSVTTTKRAETQGAPYSALHCKRLSWRISFSDVQRQNECWVLLLRATVIWKHLSYATKRSLHKQNESAVIFQKA